MIFLQGADAQSGFRMNRINAELQRLGSGRLLCARWLYFVDWVEGAAPDAVELAAVLQAEPHAVDVTHEPAGVDEAAGRTRLWMVPRLGTRSPWSSKATELLAACGMQGVRVERGQSLLLEGAAPEADSEAGRVLHDPMTQDLIRDSARLDDVFKASEPRPLVTVELGDDAPAQLEAANRTLGLALSRDEIEYLARRFAELARDPTDAELMMFAQANSEHCRHKVFNGDWTIDGVEQPNSLFAMIKATHTATPQHTLSAYHDNAAVIEGGAGLPVAADPRTRIYAEFATSLDFAIKVETHNHPTAISPHPGAATGAGGEIRDEGATGRGGKPKAGLTGFSTSHLRLPGLVRPWEMPRALPPRLASALTIMRDGPIGAAAYNNEFGRPSILGYFRTFEAPGTAPGTTRGYDKPIMLAGGVGSVRREHVEKRNLKPGDAIVVLGGPAMLIGLGGGAASSVAGGDVRSEIDFASVQRDNPEMQRRCQEVIDRCIALGSDNPIASIHDVGAGGLSNAIPEILHDSDRGGRIAVRSIPSDDAGLSPMQIWCNEAQERYVLGVRPGDVERLLALCARERCPAAVVGHASDDDLLVLDDDLLGTRAIAMPMGLLFGNAPKMQRVAQTPAPRVHESSEELRAQPLREVLLRVLRHPAVAHKGFLITIGDRSVGGLVARDPLVGRWQVPVADHALTLRDFNGYAGEAMAIGERTPVALDDAPAAARLAVAEAITNLLGAPIDSLEEIKLSANWMAAIAHPGEDLKLFEAVRAVGLEFCPALGVSIPVGKDSMSMATRFQSAQGEVLECVSPVSLVVSAFVRVRDVRAALTPELDLGAGPTCLLWVDLSAGKRRLGRSIAAQVIQFEGGACADADDVTSLRALFHATRELREQRLLLALHDVSDGGVLVTALEMAFAARAGLSVRLDEAQAKDAVGTLFSEEPGVLVQIRKSDTEVVLATLQRHGLAAHARMFAEVEPGDRIGIEADSERIAEFPRAELMSAWQETSHAMQRLRDDPDCADEERQTILDDNDPGLQPSLGFDPTDDIAAPFIARGVKPRVAILREQGVNGQVEMAAAFMRAGFEAHDVHMSDLVEGRAQLRDFKGIIACGGFSWGDVLGAGRGWATAIRGRPRVSAQFREFLADPQHFALGVCNGCQMFAELRDLVPGASHWPRFLRNRSEQFEARLSLLEIVESPSMLLQGMAGSRLPVVVSHGEGRAAFDSAEHATLVHTAARYVDGFGHPAERYPANPNGSPLGATAFCNDDGRVTILMPHPERVFRSAQMSWHPHEWGEDSPWMRLFRNARAWVG